MKVKNDARSAAGRFAPISQFLKALLQRETTRKVAVNTIWLGFDRVIGVINGLFIGAWVARYLGPEQFGIYNYVLSFFALFAPVATLGLDAIVVRSLVRAPFEKDSVLGTAFFLQLLGGIFAFALAVSVAIVSKPESNRILAMIAVVSIGLLFTSGSLVACWFQSQIQSRYVVWVNVSVLIVIIVLKTASILLHASLMTFVVISVIQSLFLTIGMFIAYRMSGEQLKAWHVDYTQVRKLLNDSWPLLVTSLAIGVYSRIDKILLGNMVGKETVGMYSAAVVFVEVWYFVSAIIASSVFPLVIRSSQNQSTQVYRQRMQYFYDGMAAIGYIITVPLVVFSHFLVTLVYGDAYAPAGPILAVYALSLVFTYLGVARGKWLVTENMNRVYMYTVVLGAIVNIGLNYILIPRFGAMGAAWATVVSYAVAAYLSCAIWQSLRSTLGQITLALLVPFRVRSIWRTLNAIS